MATKKNSIGSGIRGETADVDRSVLERGLRVFMTVEQIANRLGISRQALIRFVKKNYGCTPSELRDQFMAQNIEAVLQAQLKCALGYEYQQVITTTSTRVGKRSTIAETKTITKNIRVHPNPLMLIHLGQQYLGQKPIAATTTDPKDPSTQFSGYIIEDEKGTVIEQVEPTLLLIEDGAAEDI